MLLGVVLGFIAEAAAAVAAAAAEWEWEVDNEEGNNGIDDEAIDEDEDDLGTHVLFGFFAISAARLLPFGVAAVEWAAAMVVVVVVVGFETREALRGRGCGC
mmetsp:Transcript_81851/g.159735  ORF Transcript_81851/g.159735 Transcript_81851/m.159735 type:complete len:102 (-) Transcript_81851:321-626(-)